MEIIKSFSQLLFWLITAVGAIVAAFRAIKEMQRANLERAEAVQEQRQLLRWRQAEMARSVLDKLWENSLARSAMKMLDWSDKVFAPDGEKTEPITTKFMLNSLRTEHLLFNRSEEFVRDAFDELFDELAKIEHYLNIGLVLWEDVQERLKYNVSRLHGHRKVVENFLVAYEYNLTLALLARFSIWRTNE